MLHPANLAPCGQLAQHAQQAALLHGPLGVVPAAKDADYFDLILVAAVAFVCKIEAPPASNLLASMGSGAVTVPRVEIGMLHCAASDPKDRAEPEAEVGAVPRVATGVQAGSMVAVLV